MDLENLKAKAKAVTDKHESVQDGTKKGKKPFVTRRRAMIWFIEVMVLAFVVEQFLWRPHAERAVTRTKPTYPVGEKVPGFNGDILELRGLRSIESARLAALDGLAPGAMSAQAAQVEVSRERALPIEVENSVGMRFRLVPNGSFIMGSPEEEVGRGKGETQHVMEILNPYYLGKWEVTQEQWDKVMGSKRNPSGFPGGRRPVEEITWYDCQDFLVALTEQESLPKGTYRLPTEADWEYACRAGSQTAYHFANRGERLAEFDFFEGNSDGRSRFTGIKRPNAYGLHDMHGNVWEWCSNVFRDYPGSPVKDNTGGQCRAIRGGNWYVPAEDCRSAERARLIPTSHGNMLGFRVMRVIPELYEEIELPALLPVSEEDATTVPPSEPTEAAE